MVLPGTILCFRRWGLRVGQTLDPQFDPLGIVLKSNEKHPKSEDFRCFLELLGGFEPPTSSLPTANRRSNACCPVLSWHFCPKRMRSCELLSPLNPYRDLRQWVCVWVNLFIAQNNKHQITAIGSSYQFKICVAKQWITQTEPYEVSSRTEIRPAAFMLKNGIANAATTWNLKGVLK